MEKFLLYCGRIHNQFAVNITLTANRLAGDDMRMEHGRTDGYQEKANIQYTEENPFIVSLSRTSYTLH
jgi:hypothetical protein